MSDDECNDENNQPTNNCTSSVHSNVKQITEKNILNHTKKDLSLKHNNYIQKLKRKNQKTTLHVAYQHTHHTDHNSNSFEILF